MPMEPSKASMERILAPLQQEWVRNFILSGKTTTYLDQLRYAISHSQRALADFSVETIADLDSKSSSYSLHESYNLMFISSFTTGGLTLGFEIARSTNHAPLDEPHYFVAKVIRDDGNGVLLSVYEDHNRHVTRIAFSAHLSPGCREHGLIYIDALQFRTIVSSFPHGYDHTAFIKGLRYCLYSLETRACPICGSHSSATCGCKLLYRPKKHPMDDESDYFNLITHAGLYEGMAQVSKYSGGQQTFLSNFICRTNVSCSWDSDVSEALSNLALCDAAQQQIVLPTNLVMPNHSCALLLGPPETTKGTMLSERLEKTSTSPLLSANHSPLECNDPMKSLIQSTIVKPLSLVHDNSSTTTQQHFVHDLVSNIQDGKGKTGKVYQSDSSVSYCQGTSPTLDDTLDSIIQDITMQSSISRVNYENPTTTRLEGGTFVSSSCSNTSRRPRVKEELQASILDHICDHETRQNRPQLVDNVDKQTISNERKDMKLRKERNIPLLRRAPTLLPELHTYTTGKCENVTEEKGMGYSDIKQLKLEIRKLRNRESAQRSNEKRKLFFEKLKRDLEQASRRVKDLKEKENRLLQDNKCLRKATST